jgi:hypothetical protein
MTDIPRGKYVGRRLGNQPADEAEHFMRCQHLAAGKIKHRVCDCGHPVSRRRDTFPSRRGEHRVAG